MLTQIKKKRLEKNLKQGELAKLVGISQQYMRLIENNEADPRKKLMEKIAFELQSDIKELFFSEVKEDK